MVYQTASYADGLNVAAFERLDPVSEDPTPERGGIGLDHPAAAVDEQRQSTSLPSP